MIQCSQEYVDESGKYMTSGFEYETIWAMGANTLINDLDDIARLDHACDDLGLDTIEMGNTIAVAMDGGAIPWGDGKAALDLLEKIRSGDPLGRIIMNGTSYTAEAFGVDRVAVVKNQSLPAYDPRAVKGVGVTYATSTMGGDHTAGYAVAQNILKVGGDIDPLSKEGQVEVSKNLQIATAAVDAAGLCLFVAFAVLDTEDALQVVADLVSAKVGAPFTPDDIVNLGISVLQDELEFNRKAGFCDADDQLPYFMQTEELDTHKSVWDFNVEELQKAKV
jgi:aldehyde:ferredoxin oxidoreductase